MTNTSDTTAEARPADPCRQRRIANANARTNTLIRQRVDFYRARGFPAERIAAIVGVPIETVAGQNSA